MSSYDNYEVVIGLEVHAQLKTNSKIFAPDTNAFGGEANTQVSFITLGHPGTLPVMNEKALEYAVRMGLATECRIQHFNRFARKNYFYADLPKGYQITQDDTPICYGGKLTIKSADGALKTIRLTRIHMEEDAGKSTHDQDAAYSMIDLNRAGTPLIEIVSEPDLRSADDAALYLAEVRRLLVFLDVCDGNMEEGSLRCDANVSVRLRGSTLYGQRVEIKNLNSMRYLKRAIEHEAKRQIDLLEAGEPVLRQTRSFDADNGTTFALRSKETEDDYRYFPEPDLQPFFVSPDYIAQIAATMPPLPAKLFEHYTQNLQLSEYDAGVLLDNYDLAQYFDRLVQCTNKYKSAANWLLGPIKSYLNDKGLDARHFPLQPQQTAELVAIVEAGYMSFSTASKQLLPAFIENTQSLALDLAQSLNLIMRSDNDWINELIEQVLQQYPDKVKEYQKGKKGLIGFFMGELMKLSKGKLNPQSATQLLTEKLK